MMEVVRVSALTGSPLYHPVNWTFDQVGQPANAGVRAQPEITAMIDMKNNYALPKL